MAEGINAITGQIGTQLVSIGKWGAYLGILLIVLVIVALWFWNNKKWNLKVEFKLPRSNGQGLYSEHGKGFYNASKGYCVIKRPGMNGTKYKIANFDPKIFIQGKDTITVIQVGPQEFEVVVPQSFYQVVDENGKTALVMELKANLNKSNAWGTLRYRDSISAYTIQSLLKDTLPYIGLALVIVTIIISQYIGTGFLVDKIAR